MSDRPLYATRGPAPRRDAERRRRNALDGGAETTGLNRADLESLPFTVDLNPSPPAPQEHWHDLVKSFWAAMQVDPARKWMTAADWAAMAIVFESMSRDLSPQVVGVTEEGGVVKDKVPMKGANLASYLKFLGMIGVTEAERLRMRKEITLFPVGDPDLAPVTDIDGARDAEVQ